MGKDCDMAVGGWTTLVSSVWFLCFLLNADQFKYQRCFVSKYTYQRHVNNALLNGQQLAGSVSQQQSLSLPTAETPTMIW